VGRGSETAPAIPSIAADPDPPWEGLALPQRLRDVLAQAFPGLRRSVQTNLVVLTEAFLLLVRGGRSGQGRLSLHAITRQLRTPGRPQSRYKRLHRFLDCARFDPVSGMAGLVRLALGTRPASRLLPVLVDQTTIGMVQVLHLGTPYRGRVLPLGFWTFVYPLSQGSQNQLEEWAFAALAASLPAGVRPLWIHDRGYARVRLLEAFAKAGELFLIRGRAAVGVCVDGRWQRLGGLAAGLPPGVAVRFTRALYHTTRRRPVDLVCYRDPAFHEPWALVLPADSETTLSTTEAIQAYRERMQIEQGHRDWKTHLGVRGLQLKVRHADRLARLLMAFAIAYALVLLLGASQLGKTLREQIEIRRVRPRHGTIRTLSILTLGCALLATPRHLPRAWAKLLQLLDALRNGAGILSFRLAAQPP
jgi:Transposase DDE domain